MGDPEITVQDTCDKCGERVSATGTTRAEAEKRFNKAWDQHWEVVHHRMPVTNSGGWGND